MSNHSSQDRLYKLPENCFYQDKRLGEIDQIIQEFNKFEVPFFEYQKNKLDIKYWDFIRYDIIHSICVEKGLYGKHKIIKKNIFLRIPNIIRIFKELYISLKNLLFLDLKEINYLFISSRKFNNLFTQNDYKNNKTLFVGKDLSTYKNIIYKNSIERIIKVISNFVIYPKEVEIQSKYISLTINKFISTNVNLERIIKERYKLSKASLFFWRFIFKNYLKNITLIKFTNDNLQKSIVYLANKKNIEIYEIQHAYMGKSHEGFSYPYLKEKPLTIPKNTIIFFDSRDINYPSNLIFKKNFKKKITITKENFLIDLLIGSNPKTSVELKNILSIINNLNLNIGIKLHPVEDFSELGLTEFYNFKSFKIFNGKKDFSNIISKTKIYIPISQNSTTIFEADKYNCKIIIFEPNGRKFSSMLDLVKPIYCYSSNSLRRLILQILKA